MATTTPLPPGSPASQSQSQLRQVQYNNLVSYTSLGALILCPLLIALPPRKFDLYTVALISGTALGGNQVLREYTGRGIAERVPTLRRLSGEVDSHRQSERTGVIDERLGRRDFGTGKEGPAAGRQADRLGTTAAVGQAVREMRAAEEAQAQARAEEEAPRRGKADWKALRDAREKEALEEGRGYGGLIVDQIWEVWNWGRAKGEEGKGDEKVDPVGKEGRK
jgi:hypothetical protein